MRSEGTRYARVVVAVVSVLVLAGCSSSEGPLSDETASLRTRVDATISELDFVEDSADLDGCPFDSEVIPTLFGGVAAPGLVALEPTDENLTASALELPISGATLLGCSFVDGDSGIGLDISPAPASLDAFLREFNDPQGTGTSTWDVGASNDHRGGRFVQVFVSDSDDPIFVESGLYWLDDNVMITAYGFGPGNEALDLNVVQERFAAELDELIATAL